MGGRSFLGVSMVFGRYKKPVNIKNKQNGENKKQNKAQNISTRTLTPLSFKYTKDIDDHLNYLFPDRQTGLHIDPSGAKYQIDINIMYPAYDEEYYVLYTSGMSSEDMLLPDGLEKDCPEFKRAELLMLLPKNWDIDNMVSPMPKHETYWPMQLLRMMARYHYEFFTWIGPGYTMEYESFANNTKLSAAIVLSLGEEISVIKTRDNNFISLYLVLPLYKEEVKYKMQHGFDAFIDKFEENFPANGGREWIVDINRKNIGL